MSTTKNTKPDFETDSGMQPATVGWWTQNALLSGPRRKLIVAHDTRIQGFFAILDFCDLGTQIGDVGATPKEALEKLETALLEDAAKELVDAGVV
jgi:hypothetical protein